MCELLHCCFYIVAFIFYLSWLIFVVSAFMKWINGNLPKKWGKGKTQKSEKEGLVRYCSLSVRVQIIERERERNSEPR
ncbi:hypothetical protein VNO80_11236 [Phaseolus coccineus]|uniref:Uncharacterized protein n=1 Tax=Phaseolus coccineus TaxID=3886 RepID=A0AAN9RE71_PHACN